MPLTHMNHKRRIILVVASFPYNQAYAWRNGVSNAIRDKSTRTHTHRHITRRRAILPLKKTIQHGETRTILVRHLRQNKTERLQNSMATSTQTVSIASFTVASYTTVVFVCYLHHFRHLTDHRQSTTFGHPYRFPSFTHLLNKFHPNFFLLYLQI